MNLYMTKEKVIALYPHGRLVDADAKIEELEKEKEHYEMRLKNAKRYKKQGCAFDIDKQIENFKENIRDCKYLIRVLADLPTIEVSEDCVSRQQAMDIVYKAYTRDDAINEIYALPSVAPSVVPSRAEGEWLHKEVTSDYRVTGQCSICKERKRIDNYCPNCGAKMKG